MAENFSFHLRDASETRLEVKIVSIRGHGAMTRLRDCSDLTQSSHRRSAECRSTHMILKVDHQKLYATDSILRGCEGIFLGPLQPRHLKSKKVVWILFP